PRRGEPAALSARVLALARARPGAVDRGAEERRAQGPHREGRARDAAAHRGPRRMKKRRGALAPRRPWCGSADYFWPDLTSAPLFLPVTFSPRLVVTLPPGCLGSFAFALGSFGVGCCGLSFTSLVEALVLPPPLVVTSLDCAKAVDANAAATITARSFFMFPPDWLDVGAASWAPSPCAHCSAPRRFSCGFALVHEDDAAARGIRALAAQVHGAGADRAALVIVDDGAAARALLVADDLAVGVGEDGVELDLVH